MTVNGEHDDQTPASSARILAAALARLEYTPPPTLRIYPGLSHVLSPQADLFAPYGADMQPGPIADIGAWLAGVLAQDYSGGMMAARARIARGAAASAIVAAVIGIGRVMFERRLDSEIAALFVASAESEPVQRWLRWAQVVGKEIPATVHLKQEWRFWQAEG